MERLELKTIENIINTHKTVVEAFENSKIKDEDYCSTLDKCIIRGMEELKQYRIAEEQGLLLRLPCKDGDTVWVTRYTYDCEYDYKCPFKYVQHQCEGELGCGHEHAFYNVVKAKFSIVMIGKIGKTVFLTKEEAEEALLRMENDNG